GPFSFENNSRKENTNIRCLNKDSHHSWFEFHTNGWVADNNLIKVERSKIEPKFGNYSLHIYNSSPLSKNSTIVRTVLSVSKEEGKEGFWFYLKGEGFICLRIRTKNQKKWIYFHLEDNKNYRRAKYSEIKFSSWKKVLLPPSIIKSGDIELEIRGKKGSRINLWIDR
ncbi:MAG: hypothetical protein N2053_02485, partial [Chitinispirillaceae bacterium]|nr:hypothetical protein [Chitinispirillaceae bacterium]